MPSQNSISFTDESCSITRKNRDYFMGGEGRAYGIFARAGDVSEIERASAQRASAFSDTNNECENSVQAPCPWSNLFILYVLSEHFFFLFMKTSLYLEKMTSEFKKQGPAQTKCPKKYIVRWALQMLWVKILTKNWSKMKYNLLTQDCLRWLHH